MATRTAPFASVRRERVAGGRPHALDGFRVSLEVKHISCVAWVVYGKEGRVLQTPMNCESRQGRRIALELLRNPAESVVNDS